MAESHVNEVLNRLLVLHSRSLPMYLGFARPWARDEAAAAEVLDAIVADQQQYAERFGSLILENDGVARHGEFPIHYTSLHDLSWCYLLRQMIEQQQRDVATIEQCAAELQGHPLAQALAEEALGAAKAHLDALREADAAARGLRVAGA